MKAEFFFAYGTLRPRGSLWHLLRDDCLLALEDATVPGQLYHVGGSTPDTPVWPVADFSQNGASGSVIVGTLLLVRSQALVPVLKMEENAGFAPVRVEVEVPNVGFQPIGAVSCQWMHPSECGEQIVHGDWNWVVRFAKGMVS